LSASPFVLFLIVVEGRSIIGVGRMTGLETAMSPDAE
jgi:hypothetical protein